MNKSMNSTAFVVLVHSKRVIRNLILSDLKLSSRRLAMISSREDGDFFRCTVDNYRGVKVRTSDETCSSRDAFQVKLARSMKKWTDDKIRSVWFDVKVEDSECIPVLAADGFKFHHASHADEVTMVKWIADNEPNMIPDYAHTLIGVGGLVVNDSDEILVITERFSISKKPLWKLPGGYVDPGENLDVAVVREVLEETGVKTELKSLVAFRHTHKANFGCSDMYFIFCLRPVTQEINMNKGEISQCRWMPLQEYSEHPDVIPMNKYFVKKYLEAKKHGSSITKIDTEINLPGLRRQQQIYAVEFPEDM